MGRKNPGIGVMSWRRAAFGKEAQSGIKTHPHRISHRCVFGRDGSVTSVSVFHDYSGPVLSKEVREQIHREREESIRRLGRQRSCTDTTQEPREPEREAKNGKNTERNRKRKERRKKLRAIHKAIKEQAINELADFDERPLPPPDGDAQGTDVRTETADSLPASARQAQPQQEPSSSNMEVPERSQTRQKSMFDYVAAVGNNSTARDKRPIEETGGSASGEVSHQKRGRDGTSSSPHGQRA